MSLPDDQSTEKTLRPAIEAARRALAKMEDDEVPVRLRKVAGMSGRLPAPLMRSLVAELEGSEWLRARALEQWAGDTEGPAYRFLSRSTTWPEAVDEAAAGTRIRRLEAEVAAMTADLARERKRSAQLEGLVAAARAESDTARQIADRRVEEAKTQTLAANTRLRRQVEELRLELARVREELERIRRSGVETPRATRSRTPAPRRPSSDRQVVGRGDPLELARHLDTIARSLTLHRRDRDAPAPGPVFRLPGGIRPDRPEAVTEMLAFCGPIRLLVDGFNLSFAMGLPVGPEARSRVEAHLRRMQTLARGRLSVELVWDSSEEPTRTGSRDLDVAYVPVADDEIIARVGGGGSEVVVSSDRFVQDQSILAGAVVIFSEAVAAWKT